MPFEIDLDKNMVDWMKRLDYQHSVDTFSDQSELSGLFQLPSSKVYGTPGPSRRPSMAPIILKPKIFAKSSFDSNGGQFAPKRFRPLNALNVPNTTDSGMTSNSILDSGVSPRSQSFKDSCAHLKNSHNVIPGKSWGSMNKSQQADWMNRRCDQFYCERNEREGRGVYKCIPVES
jgi:hypothetical protein